MGRRFRDPQLRFFSGFVPAGFSDRQEDEMDGGLSGRPSQFAGNLRAVAVWSDVADSALPLVSHRRESPPPPEVTPKTSRPISTNFILPCQV